MAHADESGKGLSPAATASVKTENLAVPGFGDQNCRVVSGSEDTEMTVECSVSPETSTSSEAEERLLGGCNDFAVFYLGKTTITSQEGPCLAYTGRVNFVRGSYVSGRLLKTVTIKYLKWNEDRKVYFTDSQATASSWRTYVAIKSIDTVHPSCWWKQCPGMKFRYSYTVLPKGARTIEG